MKTTIKLQQIEPCINAIMGAGNLNENQAKTLVYYALMTWSDEPRIRPIIDLNGESGTGKNGIMKQMAKLCREPKWINARNATPAQLRNQLADTVTALVEEADKTTSSKECENWYQMRYEDTGQKVSYGRLRVTAKEKQIVREETHNHFGYTILHTQNPFQSVEMDRRILRITIYKDSTRSYRITEVPESIVFVKLALEIDWEKEIEGALSNSAWDVWLPFMRVADHIGDTDYLGYAQGQIALKTEEDDMSKIYEPKGIVLSEISPLYLTCLESGTSRVAITDIRARIRDRDCILIERQIVQIARTLGFTIVYPGNKAYIRVTSKEELQSIFEGAGVGKNWDDDLANTTPIAVPAVSTN